MRIRHLIGVGGSTPVGMLPINWYYGESANSLVPPCRDLLLAVRRVFTSCRNRLSVLPARTLAVTFTSSPNAAKGVMVGGAFTHMVRCILEPGILLSL